MVGLMSFSMPTAAQNDRKAAPFYLLKHQTTTKLLDGT
jgi:hypothetical protein